MVTTPTRRKADIVRDDLLHRIVNGDLDVDTLLPKEDELAARYGVNRSVIRESIKLLEVHRLVRPIKRRGTVVLDPLTSLSPEVIHAMLVPREGTVDPEMLAHLVELRAGIDIMMTSFAAQRRTDADLEKMDQCMARLRVLLPYPARYSTAINDLVLVMARATGNPIFEMLVHWQRRIYSDLEPFLLQVRIASPQYLQGMSAVIEAIRRGDHEQATEMVTLYHNWASPRLVEAARQMASVSNDAEERR